MAGNVRGYIMIDPEWEHGRLWRHPAGNRLEFTYVDFDGGFQEKSGVNYTDTDVLARAESHKSYVGTPNREIRLKLFFHAEGGFTGPLQSRPLTQFAEDASPLLASRDFAASPAAQSAMQEVVFPARFLDALQYPVWSREAQRSYAPPPVLLKIGALTLARCVATDVSILWKAPVDTETLVPYGADVDVTLAVVRRFNPDLGYRFDGVWR